MITASGCSREKETVALRFAAWNLGSPEKNGLERLMIKAFMEKYPHIVIEIDEAFVQDYNGAMKAAASANAIPDVFMYAGTPQADANGWCADLTAVAEKDREWSNIPLPLQEAAKIKGKFIAIPSSMYLYGYFYNKSLFEARKVSTPKAGFTVEQFKKAVEEMTDTGSGSIGLADESSIIEWYPPAVNPCLGWFSWDGGKFNLNTEDYKNGVKLARSICKNHQTYALLSEDEKKSLKGNNDWEAWNAGTVALKFDGTWIADDYSRLPFKVGFLGIPGGRTCIIPDFLFVSRNSSHPAEAYQFAKFMSSYSLEGFSKRMELAEDHHLVVTSIPMLKDKKLIDAYFKNIKIEGIREVYDNIGRNSYVEGTKVLPGYNQARWEYATSIKVGNTANAAIGDVLIDTFRGNLDIDEVAGILNSAANECVQIYPKPADN